MTASDSLPPIDDELLSAYLDDQLSGAQRARVEQRLASDAAARRLLDELRALGATLKQLPAQRPDPGLQQAIERRIAETHRTLPADNRNVHERGGPRRWLWAAAAIAAALLLALYLPEEQPAKLARVDPQAEPATPRADRTGPVLELESLADEEAVADASERLAEAPPPAHSPAPRADAPAEPPATVGAAENATFALDVRGGAAAPPAQSRANAGADSLGLMRDAAAATPPAIPVVELTFASPGATFADFRRLLTANQVELQQAEADGPAEQLAVQQQLALRQQFQFRDAAGGESMPEEVVLVEATPAQVEQILQECHLDRDTYGEVAIHRVASAGYGGQQDSGLSSDWHQYARGRRTTPSTANIAAAESAELLQESALRARASGETEQQAVRDGRHEEVAAAKSTSRPQGLAYRLRAASAKPSDAPLVELSPAEGQTIPSSDGDATQRIQVLFLLQEPASR